MEQQVVDVDDDVGEAGDDGLHEPLKTCRGTKKSHWGCNPLKLSQAGNGEGRVQGAAPKMRMMVIQG